MFSGMRIEFLLFSLTVLLVAFTAKEPRQITVFLIGDSTMANKPYQGSNPEKGWGQVLPLYLKEGIRVENHALNGRSTKSFRDEGHWEKVKDRISPGDYVLIQFGHNDQKENSPERYADPDKEYPRLLSVYVADIRQQGGIPVLVTPIVRRKFDDRGYFVDTHGRYPDAVRKAASEQGVILLDMHTLSKDLVMRWGPEKSRQLFMHWMPGQYDSHPQGAMDDTHLSGTGAFKICDLVVEEIKAKIPRLAIHLHP